MITVQAPSRPAHRRFPSGPPLAGLALTATVLFLAGLIASTAIAGTAFPSPFDTGASILAYFNDHQNAVKVSGFFQFAAAVPLAIYAATGSSRLRTLGVRAPGATIALAGGALAAAFLAVSGLVTWTLAQPTVVASPPLVLALHALGFAAGGPGSVVPFGLLIAGLAVPTLFGALLPRWLAAAGLVIALGAEFSALSLLVNGAAYLLPVARFAGLAWLITAGALLPKTRTAATGQPEVEEKS
jgi:hypothetical protein